MVERRDGLEKREDLRGQFTGDELGASRAVDRQLLRVWWEQRGSLGEPTVGMLVVDTIGPWCWP
jgi:hypothetical protein